jgi:hypothetical protein
MSEELTPSQTRVLGFPDGELNFQRLRQLGSASYGGASVGRGCGLQPKSATWAWNPGLTCSRRWVTTSSRRGNNEQRPYIGAVHATCI